MRRHARQLANTATTTLEINSLYVQTGPCAGLYSALFSPLLLSR